MFSSHIVTLVLPIAVFLAVSENSILGTTHAFSSYPMIHPATFYRDRTGRRVPSDRILTPVRIPNTLWSPLFHIGSLLQSHNDADADADGSGEHGEPLQPHAKNSPTTPQYNNNNNQKKNTPVQRMRRRKIKIYEMKKLQNTGILMTLWYILSVIYNIYSKQMLIMAPEWAWTGAWCQMALGFFLYRVVLVPLWALSGRSHDSSSSTPKVPQLTYQDVQQLLPVAMLHALVHVGGVVSMGAGAVSFTYIVKATEPAISAVLAAMILKSYLPLPVYLTLIPVIGGVSLASISELTFTWKSFNYAMVSNLASASRGIIGKKTINQRVGKNLNARNLYAIMTILATVFLLPVTALLEGSTWGPTWHRLLQAGQGLRYSMTCLVASLTYYTYNEVSFMALDNINPVSHALASTLRRVFIIVSSMVVFGNHMTPMGALGSAIAVAGAMLYSTTKQYYKDKQVKERSSR